MARIVRNWVWVRASAFDGLMNHEERNKESWVMLANAKAGGPLQLTFSYVYQETRLDVSGLNKVKSNNRVEMKADQSRF